MDKTSIFRKVQSISANGFGSCEVYYMKPHTEEKKHSHDGIEILYVLKGNCRTHKEGRVYVYRKGQAHQVMNDSREELVLICLQIPANLKEVS